MKHFNIWYVVLPFKLFVLVSALIIALLITAAKESVFLQVATHGGGATVGSQYTPLPESNVGAGDHMGEMIALVYKYHTPFH